MERIGYMITRTRALASLIESVKEQTGMSYREMAIRAEQAGHEISHQQLQTLGTGAVKKAPQDQIEAIAAAIGVSPARVRMAVFEEFFGWTPQEFDAGEDAPRDLLPDDATDEEREELARLVKAWWAAKRGAVASPRLHHQAAITDERAGVPKAPGRARPRATRPEDTGNSGS